MRLRKLLYWMIGVCVIVEVFGQFIRENIWEIGGTIDPLSWKVIFINFVGTTLMILLGGIITFDYWYLLDALGEYLNFYPSVIMFRLMGVLLLLIGLLFLGSVVGDILATLHLIPNPYGP